VVFGAGGFGYFLTDARYSSTTPPGGVAALKKRARQSSLATEAEALISGRRNSLEKPECVRFNAVGTV
jgi:hypothetical protein